MEIRQYDEEKHIHYCDMINAWLVIRGDGTCIINWTEPYYIRLEWGPEKTEDFNLANQKYILEKKYYALQTLLTTFDL